MSGIKCKKCGGNPIIYDYRVSDSGTVRIEWWYCTKCHHKSTRFFTMSHTDEGWKTFSDIDPLRCISVLTQLTESVG